MFRRIVSMSLVIALLVGCALLQAGCSAQARTDKPQVVATIFPPYDFACQVAGELAEVHMLVKPGVESHAYEPSPQDIILIQQADVFVYIGGENETWVERVLLSMDMSNKRVVRLIECVETLEEEDEHDHGIDEHIWTSPRNAVLMARAIGEALTLADPAHTDEYQKRLAAYSNQLEALDQDFAELARGAVRTELVFGDRFPFRYLCEAYGLTAYAAFPSCANDTEPSALTIASLIDRVKADGMPVIYIIEQSNGRVARVIAEATGARVLTLHSCHNVSKSELAQGATYLSLMRANVAALEEGLY